MAKKKQTPVTDWMGEGSDIHVTNCEICGKQIPYLWYKNSHKCGEHSINQESLTATKGVHDSGNRTEYSSGALRDRPGGKGMFVLLSPIGMKRIALRCEEGHNKYGDGRNWEKGMSISEFIDSSLRHIFQYLEGDITEDHLAAAAWNLQAAMHTEVVMPDHQDIPARMTADSHKTVRAHWEGDSLVKEDSSMDRDATMKAVRIVQDVT